MDIGALIKQLPDLRREAARLRTEEASVRRRAENLERIIEGVEGLSDRATVDTPLANPPAEQVPAVDTDGLRGIAAVRHVVLEDPERLWSARDVHAILEDRRWLSPKAKHPLRGTEAAINRLMHRGELERTRPGRYRVTDRMRRDGD